MSILKTNILYVRMGNSKITVLFAVVRNLAVSLLLGTLFVDKFVKGIFSLEEKIVLYSSKPVSIRIIKEQSDEPSDKKKAQKVLIIDKVVPRLV